MLNQFSQLLHSCITFSSLCEPMMIITFIVVCICFQFLFEVLTLKYHRKFSFFLNSFNTLCKSSRI